MAEIYIKNIKLSSNNNAIIKSKWENKIVKFHIFVEDSSKGCWKSFRGESKIEDVILQGKMLDIEYKQMKDYLTSRTEFDGIFYNVEDNKSFVVYIKECFGDENEIADIIYFKKSIKEEKISKDGISIILEQINDLAETTSELTKRNEMIKKYEEDMQEMSDRYEKLVTEKKLFEEKFYDEVIHLFNAKKKFIQERLSNDLTKLNILHDKEQVANKRINNLSSDDNLKPSTSKTTPSRKYGSSKSFLRTPTKSPRRTPSKRLRELQQSSDSDDQLTIFSCDRPNKIPKNNTDDSIDSSRVFKNFKIKTPVKHREEKRESSVELKLEKSSTTRANNSSGTESREKLDERLPTYQHAQEMQVDSEKELKEPTDKEFPETDEEIPCSQEIPAEISTSYYARKCIKESQKLNMKNSANSENVDPYQMDTINILNSE